MSARSRSAAESAPCRREFSRRRGFPRAGWQPGSARRFRPRAAVPWLPDSVPLPTRAGSGYRHRPRSLPLPHTAHWRLTEHSPYRLPACSTLIQSPPLISVWSVTTWIRVPGEASTVNRMPLRLPCADDAMVPPAVAPIGSCACPARRTLTARGGCVTQDAAHGNATAGLNGHRLSGTLGMTGGGDQQQDQNCSPRTTFDSRLVRFICSFLPDYWFSSVQDPHRGDVTSAS